MELVGLREGIGGIGGEVLTGPNWLPLAHTTSLFFSKQHTHTNNEYTNASKPKVKPLTHEMTLHKTDKYLKNLLDCTLKPANVLSNMSNI